MCYTVPAVGAIVTSVLWSKSRSVKLWWLNLMFYGAAIFGVIDHLWNGELFLISENWVKDLMLGVVITLLTLGVWGVTVLISKTNPTLLGYVER